MKKIIVTILLVLVLITSCTRNLNDKRIANEQEELNQDKQGTIEITNFDIEEAYKYIGFTGKEIKETFGNNYEELKVGVELKSKGYYYKELSVIFVFDDNEERVVEIDIDENGSIRDTKIGMTIDEIKEILVDYKGIVLNFNSGEQWLIYEFDKYKVRYRFIYDRDGDKVKYISIVSIDSYSSISIP